MAERLTKAAIKAELDRRIEWFEYTFGFDCIDDYKPGREAEQLYGRYLQLKDIRWQIENNAFIGGFAT